MTRALLDLVERVRRARQTKLGVAKDLVAIEREHRDQQAERERRRKARLLELTDAIYASDGNRQRAEAKAKQEPEIVAIDEEIAADERAYQQQRDTLERHLEELDISVECLRWELKIYLRPETAETVEVPVTDLLGAVIGAVRQAQGERASVLITPPEAAPEAALATAEGSDAGT